MNRQRTSLFRANRLKTVVVVTRDVVLTSIIDRFLKDSYSIVVFTKIEHSLDYIYNSLPDLLIIDISLDDVVTIGIINDLKSDPIFGQVPVLAVLSDDFIIPKWDYLFIEDYVRRSYIETDIIAKADLCIKRAERVIEINPLTRLPGNITIIKQIQRRLETGEIFAIAYADLDYFKPFNDKYGFGRGDEVLKMLGRLILNTVKHKQPNSFVGHIGGDDFIYIMGPDLVESATQEILDNFDRIIPTFYDAEDRAKGNIESIDREGIKKTFPIMGISIGIATNKIASYSHYGEVTERASEMKKYAKYTGGSCFRIDKRQYASKN